MPFYNEGGHLFRASIVVSCLQEDVKKFITSVGLPTVPRGLSLAFLYKEIACVDVADVALDY